MVLPNVEHWQSSINNVYQSHILQIEPSMFSAHHCIPSNLTKTGQVQIIGITLP